jgi:predicted lactoylglutathione lyase
MGLLHARGGFDIVPVEVNVTQTVPMLGVTDMEASLRFYLDGLGFEMTNQWTPEGKIRWCWLQLGGAALMLQEFKKKPEGKLGLGVNLNFQCKDSLAIYHEVIARGLKVENPMVGNSMWVTTLTDPDGYALHFHSPTDAPEDTEFAG